MANIPNFKMKSGYSIPTLGLGTCLFVFGGIYYALRDTNEPFQRTSTNNYSVSDEKEMGKKEQKLN